MKQTSEDKTDSSNPFNIDPVIEPLSTTNPIIEEENTKLVADYVFGSFETSGVHLCSRKSTLVFTYFLFQLITINKFTTQKHFIIWQSGQNEQSILTT